MNQLAAKRNEGDFGRVASRRVASRPDLSLSQFLTPPLLSRFILLTSRLEEDDALAAHSMKNPVQICYQTSLVAAADGSFCKLFCKLNKGGKFLKKLWCCVGGRV